MTRALALVVIANAPQLKNLQEIFTGVSKQTQMPDQIVCVFEGTEADFSGVRSCIQAICPGTEVIHAQHDFVGFSAGANRDIGIAWVLSNHSNRTWDFVFLDGDCIPSSDLMRHHASVLGLGIPAITCGFRNNRSNFAPGNTYQLLGDRRLSNPWNRGRLFVAGTDRCMLNDRDILAHNVCWSCNLGVNHEAMQLIRYGNLAWSTDSRVFSSIFDGKWGGEDTMLGICGFRSGCAVVMLDPSRSGVEHIYHATTYQVNDNLRKCLGFDSVLRKHIPITSEITVLGSQNNPSPDSRSFYLNMVSATPDTWATKLCRLLDCQEHNKITALHYLFSRNPGVVWTSTGQTNPIVDSDVVMLFNNIRYTVFDIRSFLDVELATHS